jgi:hypothetical protein
MCPAVNPLTEQHKQFLTGCLSRSHHAASLAGLLEAYFIQKLIEFHDAVLGPADEVRHCPLTLCVLQVPLAFHASLGAPTYVRKNKRDIW